MVPPRTRRHAHGPGRHAGGQQNGCLKVALSALVSHALISSRRPCLYLRQPATISRPPTTYNNRLPRSPRTPTEWSRPASRRCRPRAAARSQVRGGLGRGGGTSPRRAGTQPLPPLANRVPATDSCRPQEADAPEPAAGAQRGCWHRGANGGHRSTPHGCDASGLRPAHLRPSQCTAPPPIPSRLCALFSPCPAAFTAAAQSGVMDAFLSVSPFGARVPSKGQLPVMLAVQCPLSCRGHVEPPPPSRAHHRLPCPQPALQVDPDMQARVLEKYAQHVKELKHGTRHG